MCKDDKMCDVGLKNKILHGEQMKWPALELFQ